MRSLSVFRREKVNPTTCSSNVNGRDANDRDVNGNDRANKNKGERVEDTMLNEHGNSNNILHFQKVFDNATWKHQNNEAGAEGDKEHDLGERVISEIEVRGKRKNVDYRQCNNPVDNHDQNHREGHYYKFDEETTATSSISFTRSGSTRQSSGIAAYANIDDKDRFTATSNWSRSKSTRGRSRDPDRREVIQGRDPPSNEKQPQREQSLKTTERSQSCLTLRQPSISSRLLRMSTSFTTRGRSKVASSRALKDDPEKRASSLQCNRRSPRQSQLREKQQPQRQHRQCKGEDETQQQQQQHLQHHRSKKNGTTLQSIPQQRRSSSAPRKITHMATIQVHRNSLAGNDSVSTLQGGERGQSYQWDPARIRDEDAINAAVPTTIRTTAIKHGDDEQPPEVKVTHCGIYSSSRREAIRSDSMRHFNIETEIHCKSSKHAKQLEKLPQGQKQLVLRKPSTSKHELVLKSIVNTTDDNNHNSDDNDNKKNTVISTICHKTSNPGQCMRFCNLDFCAAIREKPGSSSCFRCAVCQRPLDELLDLTGGLNASIGRGNDRGDSTDRMEFSKRTKVVSNARGSVVLCGKCAVGTWHRLASNDSRHAGGSAVDGGGSGTWTTEDDDGKEVTATTATTATTTTTSVLVDTAYRMVNDVDTKCQYFSTDDQDHGDSDEVDDKFANVIFLNKKFDPSANGRCKSRKSTTSDNTPKTSNQNNQRQRQQQQDLRRHQRKNHQRDRSLHLLRENANLKQKNKDLGSAIAEMLSYSDEKKRKEAKLVKRIESLEGQLKQTTDSLADAKKENAVLALILERVHGAAASSSKVSD